MIAKWYSLLWTLLLSFMSVTVTHLINVASLIYFYFFKTWELLGCFTSAKRDWRVRQVVQKFRIKAVQVHKQTNVIILSMLNIKLLEVCLTWKNFAWAILCIYAWTLVFLDTIVKLKINNANPPLRTYPPFLFVWT